MKFFKLSVYTLTAAVVTAPTLASAGRWHDKEEIPLGVAQLYFELNDTDGDLGIHGKADGDAWKRMKIESPNKRKLLDIRVRSRLRRQGLTELFFESAEPTFDDLDPDVFFRRFPEGVYEWEGVNLDHLEIGGEMFLSHIIPAAPVVARVGGATENPGFEPDGEGGFEKACWDGVTTLGDGSVVVEWEGVTESHYDKWSNPANIPLPNETKIPLGKSGDIGEIAYYEFVADIDETDYKSTAVIPAHTRAWTIPASFIALAEAEDGMREIKIEILVRVESGAGEDDDGEAVDSTLGNQAAVEDCFLVAAD